jgi:hypothetical protein
MQRGYVRGRGMFAKNAGGLRTGVRQGARSIKG